MSKKKLYHMNLVGVSSLGKASKGDKGGKGHSKSRANVSSGRPTGPPTRPGGGKGKP